MNPEIYKQFKLKGHNGVDFTGPQKGVPVPVFSPYDAMVINVADEGPKKGYGKYVRLLTDPDETGRRRDIVLAHLSTFGVRMGQRVSLGNPIGMMGNTGFSSGLHLHIGLRYRDAKGNILNYDNGYLGYVDFEPYILYWRRKTDGMVIYV